MNPGPILAFRPIRESDHSFLAELYAESRREEMAQVPWLPEAIQAFLLDQYRLQHLHYTTHYPNASLELVLADGVPVGRCYVARWPQEIRLMDLALRRAFQGQGLGRRIMGELLREADEAGLPLSLHVEQGNEPVLAWYGRLGFRTIDVHGVYLRMERHPSVEGKAS